MYRPRRSLSIVTGPGSEPLTLADAKAWARVDDTDSDGIFTALITSARMAAEEYLRRTLITTSYKLTLDLDANNLYNNLPEGTYDVPVWALYGGLPSAVELPKGPVQSITSVTTYAIDNSASAFDSSNYHVDSAGARLVLNYGAIWPANLRHIGGCEITYVAGYGNSSAVPQPIKTGMLIHVASVYEQRGNCADAMALPPGTAQLYNQYRIVGDRLG